MRFNDDVILVSVFSERYLVGRVNRPFAKARSLVSNIARVHVDGRSRPSECLVSSADLESRADLQRCRSCKESRLRARRRRDAADARRHGSLHHHFAAGFSNERRCRKVSQARNVVLTKTFFVSSVYSSRVARLAIRLDRYGASNASRPSKKKDDNNNAIIAHSLVQMVQRFRRLEFIDSSSSCHIGSLSRRRR